MPLVRYLCLLMIVRGGLHSQDSSNPSPEEYAPRMLVSFKVCSGLLGTVILGPFTGKLQSSPTLA